MSSSPLAVLALGFLLGVRHALDVDHLAAVSTIVSERRGLWASSIVGAVWGLGHTAALLAAGVLVIGLHLEIPPRLAQGLELGVAAMLVVLGANLLRTLATGVVVHRHVHHRRPFVVGLVHGLAGSGALMLAIVATIPSPAVAVAYVTVFGCGSVGGMIAMSALLGAPFALAAARVAGAERGLRAVAGVASVVVGVLLAWQIGGDAGALL